MTAYVIDFFGKYVDSKCVLSCFYLFFSECDQSVESTGSSASICLKKAIGQSTLSMDLTETNCSNSFKNTVVPCSSVCENPISSHLIISTVNDHCRINEPSNGSSKNLSLSTSTCLSYISSPDPSVTSGQTLVFNSTSPPLSSLVLPHHHHVHLTHCHHHHHHPNEIHDATAITSTTNNHRHHHHHYVRHHHTPNTSHDSPQPVIVSHLPHQNSIGEKSTCSSDTSHRLVSIFVLIFFSQLNECKCKLVKITRQIFQVKCYS